MARLLDLTRCVSRLGRGPLTGIDRVELAWARHLLGLGDPLWALVRTRLGLLLLDSKGIAGLLDHIDGAPLPAADWHARMVWHHQPQRAQAETLARSLAIARAPAFALRHLLRRLPEAGWYFNLGHMNLTPGLFAALRANGWRSAVLMHDTIPLDYPHFARAGSVPVFARKLAAISGGADLVICTTEDARTRATPHLIQAGRLPPILVTNLGVEVAPPGALPPGFAADTPYYLCLGTIEPRKNHALLLDVWEGLADPPRLVIVGSRGWAGPELLARLDRAPCGVEEWSGLTDAQVSALLAGAQALLFPSLAEGFGLPLLEAAALGTPLIVSDLPVFRELAGDSAVYLDPGDVYAWRKTILDKSQTGKPGQNAAISGIVPVTPPTWTQHFNAVLSIAC